MWRFNIDRETNYISFPPLYWYPSKTDGQTTFHFTPNIGIQARQTGRLRYISPSILVSKRDRRANCVSFHPIYSDSRKTDRRTNNTSFQPWIRIYAYKSVNKVSLHPSYWILHKTDIHTNTFHLSPRIGINTRKTDGQTTFHFTPQDGIHVRQPDRLHFIWPLMLGS